MTRPAVRRAIAALAALVAALAVPGSAGTAAPASWPTYHGDNLRSGYDSADAPYSSIGKSWSAGLDGQIYASPLVVGTTVIAATENNTVYGYSTGGTQLWSQHLGAPVPSSSLPCGDVNPVGITSTPVADPSTNTAFVVAFLNSPSPHYQLVAINIGTGAIAWQTTLSDSAHSFNPLIENQRGALTLAGGTVYVPFGGRYGDCGTYYGWVMSFPESGSGSLTSVPLPEGADHEGGLWQPAGGSVDSSGNLYFTSGNTSCGSNCTYDYGESVIKFSPALGIVDEFHPSNWESLNASDTDVGSSGPIQLPGGYVFQVGKAGDGYLLSESSLGGGNHETAAFTAHVCPNQTSDAAFGGDAFDGNRIYVPCTNGVVALNYSSSPPSFSFAWQASGIYNPPIVAGGYVWVDANGNLYGLSPGSGRTAFQLSLGSGSTHFGTPAALSNQLFVPAGTNLVAFTAVSAVGNSDRVYTLDGYGGIHPAGGAPAASGNAYWGGWDIARGIAELPDGSGGYTLDGWGGVHPFSVGASTMPIGVQPTGYWQGWDIARGVVLAPWATASAPAGYTLDGWGGLHPFGNAPAVNASAYWRGWDIARGVVILPDSTLTSVGGYVLDGWGGIHPFGNAAGVSGSAYWHGWDIARSLVLLPNATHSAPSGYVLDGWGGLAAFGGAPGVSGESYWSGWDIARGVTLWTAAPAGSAAGWTVDGWGGVHAFSSAPTLVPGGYWPNWDIVRGITAPGVGSGGRR
ncbi:MAG TPA: PQQ-binding-like beta-propeller repeat protein [Candidatus Dormibacteraeota bacterium]